MAMFSEPCTVNDKDAYAYYSPGGYYYRLDFLARAQPSCLIHTIKIPNVEGWLQNIEIIYPYYLADGDITVQWALRPYKNAFLNPIDHPSGTHDSDGYRIYSSLGDADKYVTYSTTVSDELQRARGTIYFPEYYNVDNDGDNAYPEPIIIPGDVVVPGNWYTIILWGNLNDKRLRTIDDGVIATANYYPGLVQFDNGSGFDKYIGYVDNGTGWDMVMPYIDNGSGWDLYT